MTLNGETRKNSSANPYARRIKASRVSGEVRDGDALGGISVLFEYLDQFWRRDVCKICVKFSKNIDWRYYPYYNQKKEIV